MPDAYRARGRNSQRHHERKRSEVDGDLMCRERGRSKPSSERRRRRKHADLERYLTRSRQTEREEPAHRRELDTARMGVSRERQRRTVAARPRQARQHDRSLAVNDDGEQNGSHDDPRANRRPRGSANAHRRRAHASKDQQPVHERVQQVREDECDHHRSHHAHSLQISSERRVQQQRRNTPGKRVQIGLRQLEDGRIEAPSAERGREREHNQRDRDRENKTQGDAVRKPAMTLIDPAGSECMRDQRIEAEQQAHRKDADAHEKRAADAHGADRFWADPAHHQRIDEPHRHPAELRHDHWHGKPEHWLELLTKIAEPGERYRRRRCVAFHFSTTRRSSLRGSSLSSTCRRRTTSLFNHTPPFFFTMSIAADCMPRLSPPAACPASSAAINRIERCPSVFSKASTIPATTPSPARMLPWAVQYLPPLFPAQDVAFGPVYAA